MSSSKKLVKAMMSPTTQHWLSVTEQNLDRVRFGSGGSAAVCQHTTAVLTAVHELIASLESHYSLMLNIAHLRAFRLAKNTPIRWHIVHNMLCDIAAGPNNRATAPELTRVPKQLSQTNVDMFGPAPEAVMQRAVLMCGLAAALNCLVELDRSYSDAVAALLRNPMGAWWTLHNNRDVVAAWTYRGPETHKPTTGDTLREKSPFVSTCIKMAEVYHILKGRLATCDAAAAATFDYDMVELRKQAQPERPAPAPRPAYPAHVDHDPARRAETPAAADVDTPMFALMLNSAAMHSPTAEPRYNVTRPAEPEPEVEPVRVQETPAPQETLDDRYETPAASSSSGYTESSSSASISFDYSGSSGGDSGYSSSYDSGSSCSGSSFSGCD